MQRMLQTDYGGAFHQNRLVFDDFALFACPSADAAGVGARFEIFVGGGFIQFFHPAFDTHLTFQLRPEKGECGIRMGSQCTAFAAVVIGEKDKALRIDFFEQHHAAAWTAVYIDGGDIYRSRLVNLGTDGFIQPFFKLRNRMGIALFFRECLFAVIFADIV